MTQDQIGNIFSARLKQLRGDRKKAEFGRFLGVPNSPTYQRYEDGRIPDAETLQRIADRCGVTVDWLFGREREALAAEAAKRPMDYERVVGLLIETIPTERLIERQGAIINDDSLTEAQRIAAVKLITRELTARRNKAAAVDLTGELRTAHDIQQRMAPPKLPSGR